jgi:hypothetical protein
VGIGVTSLAAKLDISTTASYGGIKVNADGGGSISFYQPLSNASARNWRIVGNYEAWGTLDFQRSADNATAPTTTQLTINNAGTLVLKGGAISNSGVGVAFPATQVVSSDANTLDDYEEGTWTPVFDVVSGSATYTEQTGTYTKVGRMVTVNFYIKVNVSSSLTTQNINGLPFTGSSTRYAGASFAAWSGAFSGYCTVIGLIANATQIQLRETNSATAAPALNTVSITNGTDITASFTYFTT